MATSVIKEPFYKDFAFTTVKSSSVSPFSAYVQVSNTSVYGYKPVSATIIGGSGGVGVAVISWQDTSVYVMTNTPTTATVRVLYTPE